jgi:Tfp pilus assembly protein PilO
VSLSDRDRKILLALIPLALVAAYWFLLLAPKREEASKIREELSQAQSVRDTAQQKASQLAGAKRSFAADYATVIRLGKSIPTSVDMPSLLVQLDRAARGTGIKFTDVKAGERSAAAAPVAAPTPGGGAASPAAPGAAPAASGPGQAAQSAGNAVTNANAASGAAAGGAAASGDPSAAGASAPGLESIPLDFEFDGSFFDLADFFHRMKRFVRVANDKIVIRGRLMTINSFTFDTTTGFPNIKAQVSATVYLAPKAQGVDAGATPQGPDAAAGAAPQPASGTSAPATPTPTATVTPR